MAPRKDLAMLRRKLKINKPKQLKSNPPSYKNAACFS